jgi:hypothetical protein
MFGPEFFPTPRHIATQMLARLTNKDAHYFLEPSAGKGDLAELIRGKDQYDRDRDRRDVDCIESDPELAGVLTSKGFTVVGYDWLTYAGVSYYQAILMNPPFSNGDEHLLKAWEFMWDGEIVCLLNEETIKNPHTKSRQRLAGIIKDHGDVTFLGDCFKNAQRQTGVQVAMVYLRKKSEAEDLNDLWSKDSQEKRVDESAGADAIETMLALPDMLGNLEHYYNMANEHILKAFNHIRKASLYLQAGEFRDHHTTEDREGMKGILELALTNVNHARAEWGRKHRRDAWMTVFDKMQFRKWLDSKQTEQFLRDVERDANIPFTADNIKGTLENVISQRKRLFEQSCANVFDSLTSHFKGNTVSEGWKTNDNFKVNQKLIFPYGLRYESQYRAIGAWGMHYGQGDQIYADLDRILCVLEGDPFEKSWTVGHALDSAFKRLNRGGGSLADQATESDHFDIRFYKKGTVHLKFKDSKLWERFNAACAAGKLWLGMNTNDRDEFPGRKTRYNASEKSQAPMPADPLALITTLRQQYAAEPGTHPLPAIPPSTEQEQLFA